MAELSKKIFKGIRQVNLSTYQSYSDKEGYLWLVKDGKNRYIYFGNQLYSNIVPEETDGQTKKLITEALDKLIGQDLLHSFDNDGNLKNEIKLDLQTTDDGKEILHLVKAVFHSVNAVVGEEFAYRCHMNGNFGLEIIGKHTINLVFVLL